MPTLVFCTAFVARPVGWSERYRPWLNAIQQSTLADQVLIVDDGSPTLPGWADTRISSGDEVGDAAPPCDKRQGANYAILHHFCERLGRNTLYDFPGWFRSFTFGARYAAAHGFDRVIHIESDAYLLSPRIHRFFAEYQDGWCSLFSKRYNFPEIAVQVAAGSGLAALFEFAGQPYDVLRDFSHEERIPLTHVEKSFDGDRYGEDAEQIPRTLDYVCQVPTQREPSYYWWRNSPKRIANLASLPCTQRLDIDFTGGGNSDLYVAEGWSGREAEFRWMINYTSKLNLPKIQPARHYTIQFEVWPFAHGDVTFQRLVVFVNRRPAGEFEVSAASVIGFEVPQGALKCNGKDCVLFFHTDARSPRRMRLGNQDGRRLALAMKRFSLIARG